MQCPYEEERGKANSQYNTFSVAPLGKIMAFGIMRVMWSPSTIFLLPALWEEEKVVYVLEVVSVRS